MSSNNPFASAMNGEYKHHRDPPPPPPLTTQKKKPSVSREMKPSAPPPPSYEEAAGSESASRQYPQEKPPSSSSHTRSSRPHRSQSDSSRHRSNGERSNGERRHHHKSSSRTKSPSKKKAAPQPHNSKNLDTIDKLDVSAFYGGRFHHDGPFDACTPHRNKNEKNAPVMAFPADGPNTSMKAFGPGVNNNDRMNLAYGNFSEDQNEIVGRVGTNKNNQAPVLKTNRTSNDPQAAFTPRLNPSVLAFDANEKAAPVHGPTTAGLGTSTFLDGAPAPRGDDYLTPPSNGLGRKKSLVQKFRKNSQSESTSRRSSHDNSGEYARPSFGEEENGAGSSLLRRVKSLKVGRSR
ncbi:CIC11C00000001842 [Sungouiella intermedia]|uniref:CIC11C00000001842 n=1 Tax=Sungouiella intermedia TaxID=45354 RepID=A0A1L0G4E4_9ASCO|nr:CIC11C00000001842 [[Candida] intermedia]